MNRRALILLAALLCLCLTYAVPAQTQDKAFLWDGTHWQQVSMDGKAGYIFGIGNLADFEVAASKGKAPCVSQVFANDLKKRTVLQIVEEVDKFYQENPTKLNTSVLEVVLQRCTAFCPPGAGTGAAKK
jgi:hypothetical protein